MIVAILIDFLRRQKFLLGSFLTNEKCGFDISLIKFYNKSTYKLFLWANIGTCDDNVNNLSYFLWEQASTSQSQR